MSDLYNRSIEIIERNQAESGAYFACPDFPNYRFSWLRDGAFIAYAMDRVGRHESASRFYRWVGKTIDRYSWKVDQIEEHVRSGKRIQDGDFLHTRYTFEGDEVPVESGWGNFQVDGYGTWLWGLAEHVQLTGDTRIVSDLQESVRTTVRYLDLVWMLPGYDCWEEYPECVHTYSLSAVFGGLMKLESLFPAGIPGFRRGHISELVERVRTYILGKMVLDGRLRKMVPAGKAAAGLEYIAEGVDSSLLGAAVPYAVVDLHDPILGGTVEAIREELRRPGGGVYRYTGDTYYGGGEWILLAAWLGWVLARSGEIEEAENLRKWIESQAAQNGDLPEQVSSHMLHPAHNQEWVRRWGEIASPLLWSHAMYLILHEELASAVDKSV